MAGNKNLHSARNAKNDEFYTQFEDIAKELSHYQKHFENKVVYCNCDDPYESNFFKYFVLKFNELKLKKLITTCYKKSPIKNTELSLFDYEPEEEKTTNNAHKIILESVPEDVRCLDDVKDFLADNKDLVQRLNGDGDFRSPECVELLKESDIVCSNPPFSLFREYIKQIFDYGKHFLIVGNQNAITYKESFSLIKENKMWIGHTLSYMAFKVPEYSEEKTTRFWVDETGQKWRSMGNACWFTNLDLKKRHEKLILFRNYNPADYPKYDNYDAINVDKVADIPCDYDGVMGVPVTFLDKYNPEQFEICDARDYTAIKKLKEKSTYLIKDADGSINGKKTYARILIRRK